MTVRKTIKRQRGRGIIDDLKNIDRSDKVAGAAKAKEIIGNKSPLEIFGRAMLGLGLIKRRKRRTKK